MNTTMLFVPIYSKVHWKLSQKPRSINEPLSPEISLKHILSRRYPHFNQWCLHLLILNERYIKHFSFPILNCPFLTSGMFSVVLRLQVQTARCCLPFQFSSELDGFCISFQQVLISVTSHIICTYQWIYKNTTATPI